MSKRALACVLFSALCVYSLIATGLVYGQATGFTLEGVVKEATDEAVGQGFTVKAINQRTLTQFIPSSGAITRNDGTYTLSFLDFTGGTVDVGDNIEITVEDSSGKVVGKVTYVVTQQAVAVGTFGATVDITLGGIQVELAPAAIPADGTSTSAIKVTVQDENGDLVTNDMLTITPEAGKGTVGAVTNNGDGTYSATYTAPSLPLTVNTTDILTVASTVLGEQVSSAITLQVVPTIVTVAIDPNAFSADSAETGTVVVTVNRGVPITDETIQLELTRSDGSDDKGSVSNVTNNADGTYSATYTPAKTSGRVTLATTATSAGVSAEAIVTINPGPPANITLIAAPEMVSSQLTSRLTAMVTDVGGNGVGGQTLNASTSGTGTIGAFSETATFGEYAATYTAPIVDAEATEEITVTVAGSDVSGTFTLQLTPIPPKEVQILVVTGSVFKKNSTIPVAGANVTVTVNAKPPQVIDADSNGVYTATLFEPVGVAARTGDFVSIVVTDDQGNERGRVEFALTNDDLGEEDSATVKRDVPTDIQSTSNLLTVTGTVFLEDGQTPVDGLTLTIANSSRGLQTTAVANENGIYEATFSDSQVVAETDDELKVTVTDTDGSTFEMTHTLTGDEVEANRVTVNVTTNFLARERQVFNVTGMVFFEDGQTRADAGLQILVKINNSEQETTTEADGTYTVAFIDVLGSNIIAQTGDVVDVEVTAVDTSRVVGTVMHNVSTAEVKARLAVINVITDLLGLPTNLLVIEGTISNPDGTPVEAGVNVTITANANPPLTTTTEANGSYMATFFNPLVTVAAPRDTVEVRVTRAATGDTAVKSIQLATHQVNAQQVTIDVRFPSVLLDVTSVAPVSLDGNGDGSADILVTVTSTAGQPVTNVTVSASLTGIGSVPPTATNNGDGTYTVGYTVSKAVGTATIEITTSAVASPTETVQVAVVDEIHPVAVAIVAPTIVQLNEPVTFDGRQSTDNVAIDSFSWDFDGDGLADATGPGPHTFAYGSGGVFRATLTVTDTSALQDTDVKLVSVGGLAVRGRILEADDRILETDSAVIVGVTHVRTGASASAVPSGSRYTVVFDRPQTEQMAAGDNLLIQAVSSANPAVLLGSETYTLTDADLDINLANVPDVVTDRTSDYTIRGRIRDGSGQGIEGAIVSARGISTSTDSSGSYALQFTNYLTNPVKGEEILIRTDIPGNVPRRGMVVAFGPETPSRAVRVDLNATVIGGLAINTRHYRNFIERIFGLAIAKTGVGELFGGADTAGTQLLEIIRSSPDLVGSVVGLVPGLPSQLFLRPELPLIFGQPENMDLENFGNGIFPDPLANILPALDTRFGNLTPVLTGDKLNLYLLTSSADRVSFTLSGPQTLTVDAQKVVDRLMHTFQLEEEQAILLLPSWPGLNDAMPEVFSNVTLVYAATDTPTAGPVVNPLQTLLEDLADVAVDLQTKLDEIGLEVNQLETEVTAILADSNLTITEKLDQTVDAVRDARAQVELTPEQDAAVDEALAELANLLAGNTQFLQAARQLAAASGLTLQDVLARIPSIPSLTDLQSMSSEDLTKLQSEAEMFLTDLGTVLKEMRDDTLTPQKTTVDKLVSDLEALIEVLQTNITTLNASIDSLVSLNVPDAIVNIFRNQKTGTETVLANSEAQLANAQKTQGKIDGALNSIETLLGLIGDVRAIDISDLSTPEKQLAVFNKLTSIVSQGKATLAGLKSTLEALNRAIVLPPEDYQRAALQPREIGQKVVWETTLDIEPGKTYYYYYEVQLANPIKASLPGFPPDYVFSQWAMPDPRNLQIEDRGIVERIFTDEVQTIIAEILDPILNAVASGQSFPAVAITPEQQEALLAAIIPEAQAIADEIYATLDPMIASLFTVPRVSDTQSLWVGKFDFNGNSDGDYQLDASVFAADGTVLDRISGKSFSVDRSAPEAETVINVGENAGMYQRADGSLVATALPSEPGSTSTLSVTANQIGDQSDLVAYLYQMISHSEDTDEQLKRTWLPLIVGSSTGLGGGVVNQLNQLAGILTPDQIQLVADLLNIFPATLGPPHRSELLLRAPLTPGLRNLIGLLPDVLPITVQNDTITLNTGEYGLRVVGVDTLVNIGSNTPPVRLDIVPPDADRAKITFVILGDCNLDGDTDDPFESGPTDQELTIFSDTLNPVLTVEITERTAHPLTSIVVQFKAVGENAGWQEITTLTADQLSGAQAGSKFEVDWNIDNFDALLAAGDRVEVRAVATNALSVVDSTPSRVTLLLDEGLCPVKPQIITVEAVADDFNPDSGAPRGNITMNALTPVRVGRTKAIQFQIRRLQDSDDTPWQAIGEATDSEVIETETTPDIIGGLVGIVVDGEPSVSIDQSYRRWSLVFDSTTIDDTITGDSPAARDASLDDNPYVLRAVAIDFDDSVVEPSALVRDEFSLDNIDDVAPVTGTQIVQITDEAGIAIDPVDGVFTVGGLTGEGLTTPTITLTAEPAASPSTFDAIQLFINVRNPDGTAGDVVDIGEIFFSDSAPYTAVLELDPNLLPNGEYLFQALTIDEAGNQEERDAAFATAVDVANVEFAVEVTIDGGIVIAGGFPVEEIIRLFPGGFPVANEFVFTLTGESINPDEIDVLIDGQSARDAGLLTVEQQDETTLIVTIDTSGFDDGVLLLEGLIIKPNGMVTFALPKLNVDHTPPAITILSPPLNHQVGPLPTIHATYVDGTGAGVEASDTSVVLGLIRLLPPDEETVNIDQSIVHKDASTLVYTRGEILPGGAYRIVVSVTDTVGNIGEGTSEFTVVGTLPSVSILSPLPGQILDSSQPDIIAVFTGAGDVEISIFTLDDNAIEVTPDMLDGNRLTYTPDPPLADGRHTVVVEITDDDGNTARAAVTFTVSTEDATPPVITQVSPLGVVRSADITLSVVAFDEQSGIASVTLSLDGGTAEDGASRDVTGLSAGNHTVEAVVTNGASLETLFSWSFTVELVQADTTPPVISVVAPQGVIKEENTTLSAVVSDDQSAITRVTIALDGGTAQAVSITNVRNGRVSRDVTGLDAGTHSVTIVATSRGGSSTHTWTFTVELDGTPPVISAVAPQGVVKTDSVTLSAAVTDAESDITRVTIALDGGTAQAVSITNVRNGRISRDVTALDAGTHTGTIVATSAGGSSTHTWTFTVDLDVTPPAITSTAPHGIVRIEKPVVSVSASDDMSGVDSIDITLKDSAGNEIRGSTRESGNGTSANFIPSSALKAGTYSVEAEVEDASGNATSAIWSFTVEFDTVPPSITIVSPQGESRTTELRPVITATYTDNVSGVDESSVKLTLDGNPVTPDKVSATQVSFAPNADLSFGRHTVTLEVKDLATPDVNTATQEWSFIVEGETAKMLNLRNFPNPFLNTTTIAFTLSREAKVTVEIYDITMRLVNPLLQGEVREAGEVKIEWDGKTPEGDDLARGVYFMQVIIQSDLGPQALVWKLAKL